VLPSGVAIGSGPGWPGRQWCFRLLEGYSSWLFTLCAIFTIVTNSFFLNVKKQ
jgi:hypothetical protein